MRIGASYLFGNDHVAQRSSGHDLIDWIAGDEGQEASADGLSQDARVRFMDDSCLSNGVDSKAPWSFNPDVLAYPGISQPGSGSISAIGPKPLTLGLVPLSAQYPSRELSGDLVLSQDKNPVYNDVRDSH